MGVAVLSVVLGALLGLLPRARYAVGTVNTFALVAALAVVFGELLPTSIAEIGWAGALAFAATLGLVSIPERVAVRLGRATAERRDATRWGLEVGFAGLVLHTIGDGVGLGAYGAGALGEIEHLDVVIAIAAHTVPLVAAVVIAFAAIEGRARALFRSAILAGAAASGVGLTAVAGSDLLRSGEPWISAVVAALLLHVVAHGARLQAPSDPLARGLELVALALGLGLLMLGGHDHGEGTLVDPQHALGEALLGLVLTAAPAVVVSAAIVAGAAAWWPHATQRGALGWLARSPLRREVAPTSALLAASFLGIPYAAWRWCTGLALALLLRRVGSPRPAPTAPSSESEPVEPVGGGSPSDEERSMRGRALDALGGYVRVVAPRALAGLLAAAFVEAFVVRRAWGAPLGVDVFAAVGLALVPGVRDVLGVPIAAALAGKGWTVAAVSSLLSVSSLAQSPWVREAFRAKRLGALAGVLIATAGAGAASGGVFSVLGGLLGAPAVPEGLEVAAALILAAAGAWVVYTHGVIGVLRVLVAPGRHAGAADGAPAP